MLSRIVIKPFGTIWKLKDRCMKSRGIQAKFFRFLYHYYQFEHGSAIAFESSFETPPVFPRGMKQIVIAKGVKVGQNCTIFHQVTIDEDMFPDANTFGAPTIGDNCYIYPGAKIIGNISIGNNVVIGANVVVCHDIPDNTTLTVPLEYS